MNEPEQGPPATRIKCPNCGALEGEECHNAVGNTRHRPHVQRIMNAGGIPTVIDDVLERCGFVRAR